VLKRMRQAQSTLEYALLIGVVVGGLLTMQNYLKRSVQGKLGAGSYCLPPESSMAAS
jgi:hypothetical protein